MALRIVAADTPRPNRFATVRLPAGSAVSTYVRMTASRILASLSLRSLLMLENSMLAETNVSRPGKRRQAVQPLNQLGCKPIENQPAVSSQTGHTVRNCCKSSLLPFRDALVLPAAEL